MTRVNGKTTRGKTSDRRRDGQSIDFYQLDLDRYYTIEEFEEINDWLKTKPVDLNEHSKNRFKDLETISHFEYENGYLIPMPETPIEKEGAVCEISRQLANWNIQTGENGVPTTSQGGFDFSVMLGDRTIRAPDVAFTPKETYRTLSAEQLRTFRGKPFHPSFVVEVEDVSRAFKLAELTTKFKETYFPAGVDLGWLLDPINKVIFTFKKIGMVLYVGVTMVGVM